MYPSKQLKGKRDKISNVGGDVEQMESSHTAGRHANWHNYFGKLFTSLSVVSRILGGPPVFLLLVSLCPCAPNNPLPLSKSRMVSMTIFLLWLDYITWQRWRGLSNVVKAPDQFSLVQKNQKRNFPGWAWPNQVNVNQGLSLPESRDLKGETVWKLMEEAMWQGHEGHL